MRWQQVTHCKSFILIPTHGAVKIAHLRVQQQPGRRMGSFYMREPDISTAPQTNLPVSQTAASSHNRTAGSRRILQHPAAYLEADFTARYASLWKAFPEVSNRDFHRDRLIIMLSNVFHRYSHFWFFNIRSYCHSVGLLTTSPNNTTKSSTGNSSVHRKHNLLIVCINYLSFMQQPFILKKEISNIHNAYHIFNIALKIIKPKLLV